MFVYENQVNCVEVEDVKRAIEDYRGWGCTVKDQAEEGCAMLDCRDGNLYVCEAKRSEPENLDA